MSIIDATDEPLDLLPQRAAASHKGNFGRVVVVGGSQGKAGAAALAGKAALRSGAGLVTIVTPGDVQQLVASFEPSYMTHGCGQRGFLAVEDFDSIEEIISTADCVAVGPGLGTRPTTFRLVHKLYHAHAGAMVVDADGLNALAEWSDCLENPAGPRILTPHPGEFSRLAGTEYQADAAARQTGACALAARDISGQTVVVLKGHRTVVGEGQRFAENATGNPGMATGGSGDVLTGVIAALVGQGLTPWQAARLGTHVHGLAGDLAAEELGQASLLASDLLNYLPAAFKRL